MKRQYLDFLEDILDGMNKAEMLLDGVTYEDFESDFRINFAVVRALEIIGEAAKWLPEDFRQKYMDEFSFEITVKDGYRYHPFVCG